MSDKFLSNVSPKMCKVLNYFKEISNIPHGSENMDSIADYCVGFAKKNNLKFIRDNANNVVIFKPASNGYENTLPIILQGHLDMVCQKNPDCEIDFLKDGLKIYREGDFIKADGTTLGADNGIAVAYILAILESNNIIHPPLQAVFTTDEEIGMLGAIALDKSILTAERMINLDSEEDDTLTVSCAGGEEVLLHTKKDVFAKMGYQLTIKIKGLLGGHSGVEIHKNRINANILAGKLLNALDEFEIISINGGDKANAIPNYCNISLCVNNTDIFTQKLKEIIVDFKNEICKTETEFDIEFSVSEKATFNCLSSNLKQKILSLLATCPNGVIKISNEIDDLVETSLNLGVLTIDNDNIKAVFSLRSNKVNSLKKLKQKLHSLANNLGFDALDSGFYPPWEFKQDSLLREIYKQCYFEHFGKDIKVSAIHAGLECAVFSSQIQNLDCISVGPNLFDVHTTDEKLSISSATQIYLLLLKVLEKCCNI